MANRKNNVAIIGTNGVPPKYGGFETLAHYLVKELNRDFNFLVYCSSKKYTQTEMEKAYPYARRIFFNISANGVPSLIYDLICFIHASFKSRIIILLGPTPSGIILVLKYLFRVKVVVNHGGLNEWQRVKYSKPQQTWARVNHYTAAKLADVNITDNSILKQSLMDNFGANSTVVRYGGDHVTSNLQVSDWSEQFSFLTSPYDLSVSRAQVDNNIHLILESYKSINRHIVIISNWDVSEYGKSLYEEYYLAYDHIHLVKAIYDQGLLNLLRANCQLYIHSHSFCGTAPSLVEAMNLNIPILCFDVPTNRETTQEKSMYFDSAERLNGLLSMISEEDLARIKRDLFQIARAEYSWAHISDKYKNILVQL